MAISKVLLNDDVQIDLTDKTVSDENLQYGFTAHKADGQQVIGGAEFDEQNTVLCTGTSSGTLSAGSYGTVTNNVFSCSCNNLGWDYCVVVRDLTFRQYEAKELDIVVEFDYQITGLVSGGYIDVRSCTYGSGTQNPTGNTATTSYKVLYQVGNGQTGDLSGHIKIGPTSILPSTSGTFSDSDWSGLKMFAHTGAGSTVQISNVQFWFQMPVEDAIISRKFGGTYSNSEITVIRNGAFYSCTNLTGIDAPNVSIVNAYAFCYTKLSDISLPAMTSSVPEAMCTGCSELPSFENSAVTFVGSSAFQNCTSLSSVSFANVTFVSSQAFQGCTSLTDIYFPKVTDMGSSAFIQTQIGTVTNSGNFPSLSHTGTYAFQSATISEVYIPKFTTVNNYAFALCRTLSSVYAPSVKTVYANGFRYCDSLPYLSLPALVSAGGSAFFYCSRISYVYFPNLYSVGNNAFYRCYGLTTLCLPAYTSATTELARFQDCINLRTLDMPVNILRGGDLGGCSNLFALILRRTAGVVNLANVNNFTNTPFASGSVGGTVYAPSALLGSYSTATNWVTFDGYGTITWSSIEGSPYEHYYGDGTPIGEATPIAYPLDVGTFSGKGATVEITYFNHVKITLTNSTGNFAINVTNKKIGGVEVVDNLPKLFTIPTSQECKLYLYNVKNTSGIVFATNFRKANQSASASFGTGNNAHTGNVIVSQTLTTSEDISCFFVWIDTYTGGVSGTIEFDVAFGVGTDRYI